MDEFRSISVTEGRIRYAETMKDGQPVLFDLMGDFEQISRCQTLIGNINVCPDHFDNIHQVFHMSVSLCTSGIIPGHVNIIPTHSNYPNYGQYKVARIFSHAKFKSRLWNF